MSESPARNVSSNSLLWAVYLAASWTWCIGMFLPVLLVRDYGLWGFVVFAAPNVIGAGAMGWVIRSREASRKTVAQHETAVRLFSAVTVGFHLWFVWYLAQAGWVTGSIWPWVAVGVFGLALFSGSMTERPAEALTPYLISIAVIVFSIVAGLEMKIPSPAQQTFGGIPAVAWVAPVCLFGFLLCPYLDGTFHRAREHLEPTGARVAFGLGFGVFFLAMILFTLAYSGLLLGATAAGPRVLTAIVLHMLIQSGFTCGLHVREMTSSLGPANKVRVRGLFVSAGVVTLLAGAVALIGLSVNANISPGFETGYRIFLSAYGLLFPAYVWLVMMPLWGRDESPTSRHVLVWLVASGVAAPAFWMGFMQHREWWLVPGLLVVLVARGFIPRAGGKESLVRG